MTATFTLPTLHPDDILFFNEVRTAMMQVAKRYALALRSVEPLPMPAKSMADRMGQCSATGDIHIVMRCTVDGTWCDAPMSPSEVWDTAAHELAHLKHMNHGVAFQEFQLEMEQALANLQETHKDKVIKKLVKMQAQRDDAAKRAASESHDALEASREAEAFAAAINRMLIEHELNPSDIDYARATDNDPVIEVRTDLDRYKIKQSKSRVAWQEDLARIVARANLCTFLLAPGSNRIWFVGTKSHATVAEYTYGTLIPAVFAMSEQARREFRNACRKACNYTKMDGFPEAYGYREAWIAAFVQRIAERFQEAREAAVREADARNVRATVPGAESLAMVRLNGALAKVSSYIDNKFKSKRSNAGALGHKFHNNAAGREAGRAAADKMAIGRKGVSATATRGLIG